MAIDRRRFLAGAWLLVAACGTASAQPALEGGSWRLTVTMTVDGAGSAPQVSNVCLREELKDLNAYFAPALDGIDAECTRTPAASGEAGTMAYDLHCTGPSLTIDGKTSVTVHDPRRFSATIDIDSRRPGQHALVHADTDAIWTGPCPEG